MSTQVEAATSPDTSLDSFVLRFVRRPADPTCPGVAWHGIIRHVQSNRERAFSRWEDAVKFIDEFVSIVGEG